VTALLIALFLLGPAAQGPRDLQIPNEIKPLRIVPSGSVIPVSLITEISTQNAKVGDGIYARTVFPITVDNEIVIPVGTYVNGRVVNSERAGRISGNAALTINFQTMVLPSGLTIPIFGSLGGVSGATGQRRGEATVEGDSTKGADAGAIAGNAGVGAGIGGISSGAKGVAIGAGLGTVAGVAQVLFGRGDDLVLRPGTTIEIVLDRPLEP